VPGARERERGGGGGGGATPGFGAASPCSRAPRRCPPPQVLAGALKDNKRGRVAGENTFGKGLIQTLVPLSDGSAVAVTVARYQTPAGVDINKVGIAFRAPPCDLPYIFTDILTRNLALCAPGIDKVGITPDLRLPPEVLAAVPLNGKDFCAYAATDAAPALFG